MKIPSIIALSVLGLVLSPAAVNAAVLVTGFGTGQYLPTYTDFASETQTATTYQVTGSDFGFGAFGDLPSTVNIAGSTSFLTLTATFSGTANSVLNIELFDTLGNARLYKANFLSFTQNVLSSVDFTFFSQTGAFNNIVNNIALTTSGTGSTVNITMDTLTANPPVPEPTSTALMMVGLVSLAARRRPQVK